MYVLKSAFRIGKQHSFKSSERELMSFVRQHSDEELFKTLKMTFELTVFNYPLELFDEDTKQVFWQHYRLLEELQEVAAQEG